MFDRNSVNGTHCIFTCCILANQTQHRTVQGEVVLPQENHCSSLIVLSWKAKNKYNILEAETNRTRNSGSEAQNLCFNYAQMWLWKSAIGELLYTIAAVWKMCTYLSCNLAVPLVSMWSKMWAPLPLKCMYAIHLCVFVQVCMFYVCKHMGPRDQLLVLVLRIHPPWFLRQALFLVWKSLSRLGRQGNKVQGAPVYTSPVLRL